MNIKSLWVMRYAYHVDRILNATPGMLANARDLHARTYANEDVFTELEKRIEHLERLLRFYITIEKPEDVEEYPDVKKT